MIAHTVGITTAHTQNHPKIVNFGWFVDGPTYCTIKYMNQH